LKSAAEDFFKAIEYTNLSARLKKKEQCFEGAATSISTLDAFAAKL
jgi:hypothetical protein